MPDTVSSTLFKDKTVMITGGTGSFGNAFLRRALSDDIAEVRVFSRDEKKQDDMRREIKQNNQHYHKVRYFIGDVRDIGTVRAAIKGVDYLFHAAALKQVPSCEFFPIEAVKTNVLGTNNVLTAAAEAGVKRMICLSTDKAAYPVNAMGTSKAMMEKVIVAKSRTVNPDQMKICCTRYGNVMCSRGSVIPIWMEQLKAGKPLQITDPTMTRFIMSLEEAVDLVLFAFEHGTNGDILVQKAPSCTIETLSRALCSLFGVGYSTSVIGLRHGEKMYETLLTKEEYAVAEDRGNFFRVPCDKRGLDYDEAKDRAALKRTVSAEFNSDNTQILNTEQVKAKLMTIPMVSGMLSAFKGRA
ncbi:MAG: polysaccharide biosynthesis protein [Oscillospiraceae bacterium]|nr:polysaccharide biosynthesis protein [Oscillospiraceae bacterium]